VGTTPDAATTTLDDNEELPDGQRFIYWVRASVNGKFGSLSNFAIVTAENTAPVANDDLGPLYSIPAGSPGANFPSVLANDTDVDSSPSSLRAVLVTGPLHGTLVLNTDGTFFYSPAPGFIGADTFTYQANNGTWTQGGSSVPMSANSNTATVTIAVTQPPTSPATFQSTDVWLSTSSSNRRYDLMAEVLKNGVKLLEKVVTNQTLGFGTTFNKAIYVSIGAFAATAVDFGPGDTLSVRVSLKLNSGSPGGQNASGATRRWYNVPTPPPAANSHVRATRAGTTVRYYLVTPFALQKDGTVAGPTQYSDAVVDKTGFTVLGTWSVTGPGSESGVWRRV
jgi:hypothetical protein